MKQEYYQELKTSLHKQCEEFLAAQIFNLQIALKSARESGNDETKSSTGDKHETGRAMMQMEQEKIGHQLKELESNQLKLEKISVALSPGRIAPGHVVKTDKGNFYIAIAAGKLMHGGETYFAISPVSPLGILFLQSAVGREVKINATTYRIFKAF